MSTAWKITVIASVNALVSLAGVVWDDVPIAVLLVVSTVAAVSVSVWVYRDLEYREDIPRWMWVAMLVALWATVLTNVVGAICG